MKRLFPLQITKKIFLWISLIILVSVIIQASTAVISTLNSVKQETDRELTLTATSLAARAQKSLAARLQTTGALAPSDVSVLNAELQPYIDDLAAYHPDLGLGVYSIKLDSAVAVYPFRSDLLQAYGHESPAFAIYTTGQPSHYSRTTSRTLNTLVQGVTVPITVNGEIIGHTWATKPLNGIYSLALHNAAPLILTGLVMLLLLLGALWVFAERLRQSMEWFAQAVAGGSTTIDDREFPELSMLLRKISDNAVTIQKQNDEKLRLESALRQIYDMSADMLCVVALESGRFLTMSPACQQILGYSPDEMIGRPVTDFLHPDDKAKFQDNLSRRKHGEPTLSSELRYMDRNGTPHWISWSSVPDPTTGVTYSVGRDIKDSKRVELEMQRLDRLNLAGQIAASVGHELRNPMTTVRGFLQFFMSQNKYPDDHEVFDLMISELDRANHIITEFLSVAKTKPIEKKMGNINRVITALNPLLDANAHLHQIDFQVELGSLPDSSIDEKEIRQLLLNLYQNAVDAMPSGGRVVITTHCEDDKILLTVADQGGGIPANVMERLYTPFYTTKENGTGLGLAVCHRIVTQHEGTIEIETSGQGTKFTICFPVRVA